MSFKVRVPAILLTLLFSSVLVVAASPSQTDLSDKAYSSIDLVLFGSLGVKFLSSGSR
jgi:hypothetical protein